MQIEQYIPVGSKRAISRAELCTITGLSDRKLRDEIHQARRHVAILNMQDGNGYFIPDHEDPDDVKMVQKFVNQETKRLKSIGWALKSARGFLKDGKEAEITN